MRHSSGVITSDTLGMKTNNILTGVFVVKTQKRSQHVNTSSKVGGQCRAQVVPATDLLMQIPLSYEG